MSNLLPDCPAVRLAEVDGWPESEPKMPVCPICGEMCEQIYYVDDEIAGCEACIKIKDARGVDECFTRA